MITCLSRGNRDGHGCTSIHAAACLMNTKLAAFPIKRAREQSNRTPRQQQQPTANHHTGVNRRAFSFPQVESTEPRAIKSDETRKSLLAAEARARSPRWLLLSVCRLRMGRNCGCLLQPCFSGAYCIYHPQPPTGRISSEHNPRNTSKTRPRKSA